MRQGAERKTPARDADLVAVAEQIAARRAPRAPHPGEAEGETGAEAPAARRGVAGERTAAIDGLVVQQERMRAGDFEL